MAAQIIVRKLTVDQINSQLGSGKDRFVITPGADDTFLVRVKQELPADIAANQALQDLADLDGDAQRIIREAAKAAKAAAAAAAAVAG